MRCQKYEKLMWFNTNCCECNKCEEFERKSENTVHHWTMLWKRRLSNRHMTLDDSNATLSTLVGHYIDVSTTKCYINMTSF